MRARILMAILLLSSVLAAFRADAADPARPGGPLEYPHAGIALAIPEEFSCRTLRDPLEVLRAVRPGEGRTVLTLSLAAFPVDAKVTAEAFADAMLAELRRTRSVSDLKILGKAPLNVAGISGTARRIGYTAQAGKTVTVRAYFLRESKKPALRICYMLSVEAVGQHQAELQSIFGEVVESVRLPGLQHPSSETTGALGPMRKYEEHGFGIRLPIAWHVAAEGARHRAIAVWGGKVLLLETPAAIGQVDYLLGGRTGPRASVVVASIPEGVSPRVFAEQTVKAAASLTPGSKLLAEGPATMGGLHGHQRAVQLADKDDRPLPAPPLADGLKPYLVVRSVCVPEGRTGRGRGYSLLLRCLAADSKSAAALMDRLADGFELLTVAAVPATQPESEGGTTQPAAEPTSVPLTWPAPTTQRG